MKIKLLIDEKERKHLVFEKGEFHTDLGLVKFDGHEFEAYSHTGKRFYLLDPDLIDIYEKMARTGSYMLLKDIGQLVAHLGIGSGDVIVDAGTGSAGLAVFMGKIVGLSGKIVSYEKNPQFAVLARKNIENAGVQEQVIVRERDVLQDGFEEEDDSVDNVTLDLRNAFEAISGAKRILKRGGRLGVYSLYIEHAKEVNNSLCDEGFIEVKTVESITREIEFRPQGTRPKTSRVGHSGYLSFGRKV